MGVRAVRGCEPGETDDEQSAAEHGRRQTGFRGRATAVGLHDANVARVVVEDTVGDGEDHTNEHCAGAKKRCRQPEKSLRVRQRREGHAPPRKARPPMPGLQPRPSW